MVVGLVLSFLVWTVVSATERTHPPRFVRNPPKEIAYDSHEGGRVELPCVASAEPEATYRWEKDGKPLIITGTDIKKQPGSGTLVIEEPLVPHEGIYQCFASNHFGTALSVKTMLKRAVLDPFAETVPEVKVHTVDVGDPLTLRCRPPKNYPSGSVYWEATTPANNLKPLTNDARVSQDYDGNLHIANVIQADSLGGETYVCVVSNNILRSLVQGDDKGIEPIPAMPDYQAPSLKWASETSTTAIFGTTKTMKCIFSGYPTPTVKWIRLDAPMLGKNEETSFGQELTVRNVVFEDGGEYQCVATNMERGEEVTKDFHLNVDSMPFWVIEPEDVNSAEEENAEFVCMAGGKPKPEVTWSLNGKPLSKATPDSRRVLRNGVLSFTNLTETDAQVLQCNASNKHGYIFANAYLNVAADPPTWVQAPKGVVVSAEGQAVNLTCRVYGAPKPVITWTYEGYPINDTTRFTVTKDGDLHIHYLFDSDQGNYQCHAVNKFGDIMGAGYLRVKGRTEIIRAPISQVVNASTTVIFHCEATTDLTELKNLEYKWKFNKFDVLELEDTRISQNTQEHSLQIMGATVRDTGDYTCVAQNSIDSDEVTAHLVVQGNVSSKMAYF